VDRRNFLRSGLATAGLGAAALTGCTTGASTGTDGQGAASGGDQPGAARYVAFTGDHQAGITNHPPAAGLAAAFRVVDDDRDSLADTLADLSDEIRRLMDGEPFEQRDPVFPPVHTGTLGDAPPPTDLTVVVSVGASLFDERFGLADQRPRELVRMPFMANDRLDPALSHGDLLLNIGADTPDATIFALRQLMRRTRGSLVLQWMVEGFNRRDQPKPGEAGVRNLMGFKDGTANLDATDDDQMVDHVWVREGDDEPVWAVGGSYEAVRIIRMFVERWDRVSLREQEAIMGRHKESGAPLGGSLETDAVDFSGDPEGEVTPLDAHIRLANPRTPGADGNLILRRGFSYSRGFDGAGQLDQGLCFVSYQRSLRDGFVAVQERLAGEPLEEYILPIGGGFFFALPGVTHPDGWLGQSLLEA
jgi:deferrochelatase/peroxidase EfeB